MGTSAQQLDKYKLLVNEYQVAVDGFGVIAETDLFSELLGRFEDYPKFLAERKKSINSKKLVRSLSQGTGIIEVKNTATALRDIFYYSHMAACCELFMEWRLPIDKDNMRSSVLHSLQSYRNAGEPAILTMINRIHRSDAVRTMQILKLLGLISRRSSNIKQLSFAAGAGSRDIDGLHMTPIITRTTLSIEKAPKGETITFGKQPSRPKNIVLVDNDPDFKSHYATINAANPDWLMAINEDADQVMQKLPATLANNGMGLRNFVVGLRIDHRMIPDVNHFLNLLAPLIDQTADIIFSIGAGHTLEEFKGRVLKMDEIFHCLTDRGFKPVRIKLYSGDDFSAQRGNPAFGVSACTTYEIIYCRLIRKKM